MTFSKAGLRKISAVAAPAFLFILFLYLVLPAARKYYVRSALDLKAVEAENVIVYAPDESTAQHVLDTFITFRSVFYDQFTLDLEPTGERVRIHVFENGEQLSDYYSQKNNERIPHNSGYYDPRDRAIALEDAKKAVLEQYVKHEAVHHFLQQAGTVSTQGLSPWLSEGIAFLYQYYAITKGSDGNLDWYLPRTAEQAVFLPYSASVQLKKPLDVFLRLKGEDFQREDNPAFYREARLLVFYLLKRQPKAFWSYVRFELREGMNRRETFQRLVGEPEKVEDNLKQWVRRRVKKMEGEIR